MPFGDSVGGPFYLVDAELLMMSHYLREMQSYLQRDLQNLEQEVKALQEEFDRTTEEDFEYSQDRDEYAEYLFEPYQGRYDVIGREFPRRLFSSFLVSLYSFIEDELSNVCSMVGIDKGDYVQRGEPCHKKSSIDLPACQIWNELQVDIKKARQWEELQKFRTLRNDIVHKNGLIPYKPRSRPEEDRQRIDVDDNRRQYLESNNLIELESFGGRITPKLAYCQHVINISRDFLLYVYMETGIQKKPYVRAIDRNRE
jgi:hypothetical protein